MGICEQCGYHLKMSSSDRIALQIDPGTWNPMDEGMVSMDPIEFHSEEEAYKDRIDSYHINTCLTEAVQTGIGQLNGIPIAIGVMDFQFMGGNIQSIRIELKEGIYTRRVLYLEIRGQGAIPLTRTDENLTPREMEQKAAELAYFLRVPIEGF
ncbi:uncharacterized protein LOC110699895 [Chenopodium quinoa]|uniref:uncharacterized protein LOC110699895 n=1 Tax=Chenopodium quinoa TaxID=63459 RepID=UPI000B785B4F|nr:uncharacterized protein LOC110699895 [Chenopodium quinoa]